jgi:hypothetical protein
MMTDDTIKVINSFHRIAEVKIIKERYDDKTPPAIKSISRLSRNNPTYDVPTKAVTLGDKVSEYL